MEWFCDSNIIFWKKIILVIDFTLGVMVQQKQFNRQANTFHICYEFWIKRSQSYIFIMKTSTALQCHHERIINLISFWTESSTTVKHVNCIQNEVVMQRQTNVLFRISTSHRGTCTSLISYHIIHEQIDGLSSNSYSSHGLSKLNGKKRPKYILYIPSICSFYYFLFFNKKISIK